MFICLWRVEDYNYIATFKSNSSGVISFLDVIRYDDKVSLTYSGEKIQWIFGIFKTKPSFLVSKCIPMNDYKACLLSGHSGGSMRLWCKWRMMGASMCDDWTYFYIHAYCIEQHSIEMKKSFLLVKNKYSRF